MKSRILVVCDSARIGGIQRALAGFLQCINHDRFDVDLFLFDDSALLDDGEFEGCRIIPSIEKLRVCGQTMSLARQAGMLSFAKRALYSLACKTFGSRFASSFAFRGVYLDGNYDFAISFTNDAGMKTPYYGVNRFVLDHVCAGKRIAWIHVDPSVYPLDTVENHSIYKRFDRIACVSSFVREKFCELFPECEEKTIVVNNFIEQERVLRLADCGHCESIDHDYFNFATVGRIEDNKNQILVPELMAQLKERGIPVKWHLIGDGVGRKEVVEKARCLDVLTDLVFWGEIRNPYALIKQMDALVSVSKSESFGLSIAEALILAVPVVCLEFPAVDEIVKYSKGLKVVSGDDIVDALVGLCKLNDKIPVGYHLSTNVIEKQIEELLG